MSVEILREAARQARAEAQTSRDVAPALVDLYGDDAGSLISASRHDAVADWLEVVAARNEELLSSFAEGSRAGAVTAAENTLGWEAALAVARAYLGEEA